MTKSTGSNTRSRWSNHGQAWSSPQNPHQQSLMIPLRKSTHTSGHSLVKTPVKPRCPTTSSGTFAVFSKIHLNTSKSPNIKVVQFFEGHNFAFGWHCKFGVEDGEKLGQLEFLLFIGAMKNPNIARRSCSNR
jgi:hypothetical protein